MAGHSRLSPSTASRWMYCPGSVPLTEQYEDKSSSYADKSSSYADEGTNAHHLAALCLGGVKDAAAFVGQTLQADGDMEPFTVDEEMASYVQVYLDQVRLRADGSVLLTEQRVSTRAMTGTEDHDGTADAVILDMDQRCIEVHDLKYGRGVMVYAENNKQLMLYALGALCTYNYIMEADLFRLVIHQPRRDHFSEYEISREELLVFAADVKVADQNIAGACIAHAVGLKHEFSAYLIPSAETCRWCPAKATCPALLDFAHSSVFDKFDNVKKPDSANTLPDSDTLDLIEQWCRAVKDFIFGELKSGGKISGWKLVRGRKGNRKWRDDSVVEVLVKKLRLGKKAFVHKLRTPAQLEQVVKDEKWNKLNEHVIQPEGAITLVPESDKREAVSLTDQFDDESTL